jgi:hypothetical protein
MSATPEDIIARIAASQLGPGQPPAAAAVQTGPAGMPEGVPAGPPAPPPEPPATPPTPSEIAQQALAPKDEGTAMGSPAVSYKVPFGEGDERELTPDQIKGTFDRYGALNHRHAQLKPFVDLGDELMKRAPPGTDASVIAQAMVKALTQNVQMGGQQQAPAAPAPQKETSNEDLSEQLQAWERDNAVSLPPGYKELMSSVTGTTGQMSAMRQMLEQVLGQAHGSVQAARESHQQGQQDAVKTREQHIINNLNRVQQQLGLPVESAQDFQMFTAERGYTLADFADLDLLMKVASDFKATMGNGELERLRAIHSRRQAFTGAAGGSPGAGPGAAPDPGAARLQGLTDFAMKQRGMS